MALPDSGMSIVMAVSSNIFKRRTEEAIKNSQDFACIYKEMDDGTRIRVPVVIALDTFEPVRFKLVDSEPCLQLNIYLKQIGFEDASGKLGEVLIGIVPTLSTDGRSVSLVLSYKTVIVRDLPLIFLDELDTYLREELPAILDNINQPISLDGVLPSGTENTEQSRFVEPALIKMIPEFGIIGSTLLIGLECTMDTGVNRKQFTDNFNTDLLAETALDWTLQIDKGLFTAKASEIVMEIDISEQDSNWDKTTGVNVFWSEDDLDIIKTHGTQQKIEDLYLVHPLWFVIEGCYDLGYGFPVPSHIVGFVDFKVEPGSNQLVVYPTIIKAGSGVLPFPNPEMDPLPIETDISKGLFVDNTDFDSQRFVILGGDDHPGLMGIPTLWYHSSLRLDYIPAEDRGLCLFSLPTGRLNKEGKVIKKSTFRNEGDAPLWICNITIAGGATTFEVKTETETPLEYPIMIPAGQEYRFAVLMQADHGVEQQGSMQIHSNDYDNPIVNITLAGLNQGPAEMIVFGEYGELLCIRKPDLIPPQDWFDIFADFVPDIGKYTQSTPAEGHFAEITILSEKDSTFAAIDHGELITYSMQINDCCHLTLPAENNRSMTLQPNEAASRSMNEFQIHISQSEVLGHYKSDNKPLDVVSDSQFAYVLHNEGVDVLRMEETETKQKSINQLEVVSKIEHNNISKIDLSNNTLFLSVKGAIKLYDINNPFDPVESARLNNPGDGQYAIHEDKLFVVINKSIHAYRIKNQQSPQWLTEIRLASNVTQIGGYGKVMAFSNDLGAYLVNTNNLNTKTKAKFTTKEDLGDKYLLVKKWDQKKSSRINEIPLPIEPYFVKSDNKLGLIFYKRTKSNIKFDQKAVRKYFSGRLQKTDKKVQPV